MLTPLSISTGVLVSQNGSFRPQLADPQSNHGLTEAIEEDNEESDEQPVQILVEVGTIDSVVVWDHEKVPGDDDVFLRGLGEEGRIWRAGMHNF